MKNKKILIISIIFIIFVIGIIFLNLSNETKISESSKTINTDTTIINNNEKSKFDKNDIIIDEIYLGMTQEEVKNKLGEPQKVDHIKENVSEYFVSDFIYGEYIDYYYKDLILTFFDIKEEGNLTLGDITITGSSIKLSNGLSVGKSSKAEVIHSYYNDRKERVLKTHSYYGEESDVWGILLYGDYLYTAEQGYKAPERYEQTAFINYNSNTISYICTTPFENYTEEIGLIFYIGEDDKVASIKCTRTAYE